MNSGEIIFDSSGQAIYKTTGKKCYSGYCPATLRLFMVDALNNDDYGGLEDIDKQYKISFDHDQCTNFWEFQMITNGVDSEIETYVIHTSKIIINKNDILKIGLDFGINIQNLKYKIEFDRNILNEIELYYNAHNEMELEHNAMNPIYDNYDDKDNVIKVNLYTLESINDNIVFSMMQKYDSYIKKEPYYLKNIGEPIFEYGSVLNDERGIFTFIPRQTDLFWYLSVFMDNIRINRSDSLLRKIILSKKGAEYILSLVTESVNNNEHLKELIEIDLRGMPYRKMMYSNKDGTFVKKFRTASTKEAEEGIICVFS